MQIVVDIDDLREIFNQFQNERDAAKQNSARNEKYLTRGEVCDRLEISLPTLHRWVKDGYLKPVEIGRAKRYRESDINKLLLKEVKE